MNFQKDLKELKIGKDLHQTFKHLKGYRHTIQYETPDYVFSLSKTFKPKIECFGITNRCSDGKYILFLDYDKTYKDIMLNDLNVLQKVFPKTLSNFYIATTEPETKQKNKKTKGSYHVVNFAKMFKYQVMGAIKYCNVDPLFAKFPETTAHKCHVLRTSEKFWKTDSEIVKEKPTFLEKYPERTINPRIELSNPHYRFFQRHWNIQEPFKRQPMKFDDLKDIEIHKYSTYKGIEWDPQAFFPEQEEN